MIVILPRTKSKRVRKAGRYRWQLISVVAILATVALVYFSIRPRWKLLEGQVHVVGFSADGRVLATIDRNGVGYLWDPETGESRDDLAGKVMGLPFPFSPDGRYHVARLPMSVVIRDDFSKLKADEQHARIIESNRVSVKETRTKRSIIDLVVNFDSFQARRLGFTADGKRFFSVRNMEDDLNKNDSSCVWSLPDGEIIYEQDSSPLAISSDGERLATDSIERIQGVNHFTLDIVRVQDAVTERSFDALSWSKSNAFSTDNRHLIQSAASTPVAVGEAKLYDLDTGETALLVGTPYPLSGAPTVAQFIHGDRLVEIQRLIPRFQWVTVCTATTDDFRIVWDARSISSNRQWCYREDYKPGSRIPILKVYEVSPEIASNSKGQAPSPSYEFALDSPIYPCQSAISDDGRTVVVVTGRGDIMVVDMIDGKILLETTFEPSWIAGIYLSPNGRHVAATVQSIEGSHVRVIQVHNR